MADEEDGKVPSPTHSVISSRRKSLHHMWPKFTKNRKPPQLGKSLIIRKELYPKRQKMCDLSLAMAVFGIVVMIVNTELEYKRALNNLDIDDVVFRVMRWILTISTGLLIICIFVYHKYDVKLLAVNYAMDDWRLAVTPRRILKFLIECIICLIHPFPPEGFYNVKYLPKLDITNENWCENVTVPATEAECHEYSASIHVLSNILMFLRLYLVGRYLVVHSRLSKEASFQSLALLNRIHFNFQFILKSVMVLYPGFSLTVFITCTVITMTWAARFCDLHEAKPSGVFNSAWLIIITFLTVGYGEITPHSYCGRMVATLTGVLGVASTAFIVAILAQKMEFSRSEEEVHNFVLDIELKKKIKLEAANVIKHGWKLNRMKYVNNIRKSRMCYDRRKLLQQMKLTAAIYRLRVLRDSHRRLKESSVNMMNITHGLGEVQESNEVLNRRMDHIESKLDKRHEVLDKKMDKMEGNLDQVFDSVCRVSDFLNIRQSRQSPQSTVDGFD